VRRHRIFFCGYNTTRLGGSAGFIITTRGLRYLRRLLVASMISRLVDSALPKDLSTQFALTVQVTQAGCLALHFSSQPSVYERSTLVLRSFRVVVAGLLLTMSCALLLDVLAVRLDVAIHRSGTSRVESVGLSWTTLLETVRDRPLSLLAHYTRGLGHTPLRALLDYST